MTRLLERRQALHRELKQQQQLNIQMQQRIEKLEALANLGMASAMIAHEMNNILTPLGNYALLAMNHPDDKSLIDKTLTKTADNTNRAARILDAMMSMARGDRQEACLISVSELVEGVFTCLARDFARDGIRIELNISPEQKIEVYPVAFQQVLMNLILNAREAMLPRGGILKISSQKADDEVRISVCDTGCGIDAENLGRIFEPFFSTKTRKEASESGMGLGLAFCAKVMKQLEGRILVQSEPGQGSEFILILPNRSQVK